MPRPRIALILRVLCALWLGLFSAWATGSEQRALNEYFRETWTTRQGLPHNLVQGVAQTPDGYLWFATWEGVARYNGVEFKAFDRANVPALGDNGIRALHVAKDGSLILGTSRGGITRLRDGHWSTLNTRDGLAQDEIMDVLEDHSGRVWVATESAGLDRIEGSAVRHFTREHGLPSLSLYLLGLHPDGSVWAGTTEGLVRVDGDRVEAFGVASGLPPGPAFDFAFAADGTVYVGTEQGVFRREGARFVSAAAALPVDAVQRLLFDRSGSLWIGTVNHGVLRLRDGLVESLGSDIGLPNNRVSALFEDREGSIWVGTNGGLLRLRDAPFVTYTSEHGLADNYVRSVLQSTDGTLWAGTSRGLSRWRDGRFGALAAGATLSDSVLSLADDAHGGLWIGTYASGLVHWQSDGQRSWRSNDGLAGNQVRAIAIAANGDVWVGTARGLSRLHEGQWRSFGLPDGLPREFIIALHAARDGRLWIGTANGAAIFDGEQFTRLDLFALDGIEDVFGFHEDADGTMWMATDRGLVRHRLGKLASVSRRHGLSVETVFQVVLDREAHFWLTSNRGVMRLAHADADAVADGQRSQLTVETFGEADGMGSAQCNGGSGPAAWLGSDGRVWVATAMGLSTVDPSRLARFARSAPPVVIEEVRIDDRVLPARAQLELAPGTRKIELHFAGLSYLMPQKIRYRYRLDGFDADWVERGNFRFAQFTNLAPGEYRFRVSAANANGEWSPAEASLTLRVAPRLWQRPGFWAGIALALLLLLYVLYRARVHQLRSNERRLRELIDQRTQDLRAQTERLTASDAEKSALLVRLREHADAFERQAREDALTGLANRRWFDEQLDLEFASATRDQRPLAIALVDIDHFKRINDRYSHAAGDAALRAVADTMRSQVRAEDCVARYGGEEFALLFVDTALDEARILAERLRAAIEQIDCSAFAAGLQITVSIGIAERIGINHHERLVSLADARLYEAKHAGRNRVCG